MAQPMVNPQQHYLRTQIETASQPQLLLMLFDGAVRKLNLAKKAMTKKDIETSHNELTKVQKIFTELMVALDMEMGGELAQNLLRIYDFLYHQLVKANIKQRPEIIDEIMPIVENLRDGWRQAVEKFNHENGETAASTQNHLANTVDKLTTSKFAQQQSAKSNGKNPAGTPANGQSQPAKEGSQQPAPASSKKTGAYAAYAASPAGKLANDQDQPTERPRLNLRG